MTYKQALDGDWTDLGQTLRRFHDPDVSIREATGTFHISSGDDLLSKIALCLTPLPDEGEEVPVQLRVERDRQGEIWMRSFDGDPVKTYQKVTDQQTLMEYVTSWSLRFKLRPGENGRLHYEQVRFSVGLGPVKVPLPSWMSPRVHAVERPTGQSDQFELSVRMELPGGRVFFRYGGTVTIVK